MDLQRLHLGLSKAELPFFMSEYRREDHGIEPEATTSTSSKQSPPRHLGPDYISPEAGKRAAKNSAATKRAIRGASKKPFLEL